MSDDAKPQKVYSKRTRTREGRTYYDNVRAASLEDAYARYGQSHMEGAVVDIVEADEYDIEMGERGLSHP